MEKLSRNQQWIILFGVSLLLGFVLQYFHVPAALLGPIIGLMLLCGAMAWMLTKLLDVDLLTAYLATSPGALYFTLCAFLTDAACKAHR